MRSTSHIALCSLSTCSETFLSREDSEKCLATTSRSSGAPSNRNAARFKPCGRTPQPPAIHPPGGPRPPLADLPPTKKIRGRSKTSIGDIGPMGRILVRGEAGHDIIPELYPLAGEPVTDT